MTYRYCKPAVRALGLRPACRSALGAAARRPSSPRAAAAPIKLGIVSFLSGPAAQPVRRSRAATAPRS